VREGNGEEVAGWAWPNKRKGSAGEIGPKQAKRRKGRGKERLFLFIFTKKNFKLIFKMEFEFKLFCSKPHITKENVPA